MTDAQWILYGQAVHLGTFLLSGGHWAMYGAILDHYDSHMLLASKGQSPETLLNIQYTRIQDTSL